MENISETSFATKWTPSETEYAEQFWSRMHQFNVDHDWFLTANSIEFDELKTACLNLAPVEDIAAMIWNGSMNEAGLPAADRKEVLDAVVYVKDELDAMIERSDRVAVERHHWIIPPNRPSSQQSSGTYVIELPGDEQRHWSPPRRARRAPTQQISLFVDGCFKTNHLHVEMMEVTETGYRYFNDMTTEFADRNLKPNEAFVYLGFEGEFLCRGGIAKFAAPYVVPADPENEIVSSEGSYRKMEFDMDKLAEYDPVGVEQYRKLHEEKNELKKEETAATEKAPADISEEQNARPPMKHRR